MLAIVFLLFLKRTNHINSLEVVQPAKSPDQVASMLIGLIVLVTIVLQEEVLNRGYVTLNLLHHASNGSYPDIHNDFCAHSFSHQSRQRISTDQLDHEWTGIDNILSIKRNDLGAGHSALCH